MVAKRAKGLRAAERNGKSKSNRLRSAAETDREAERGREGGGRRRANALPWTENEEDDGSDDAPAPSPSLPLSRPLFLCLRHSVTGESDAHYNYKRGASPSHERRERTGDHALGERERRLKRGMESETEAQWKKKEDEEDQWTDRCPPLCFAQSLSPSLSPPHLIAFQ